MANLNVNYIHVDRTGFDDAINLATAQIGTTVPDTNFVTYPLASTEGYYERVITDGVARHYTKVVPVGGNIVAGARIWDLVGLESFCTLTNVNAGRSGLRNGLDNAMLQRRESIGSGQVAFKEIIFGSCETRLDYIGVDYDPLLGAVSTSRANRGSASFVGDDTPIDGFQNQGPSIRWRRIKIIASNSAGSVTLQPGGLNYSWDTGDDNTTTQLIDWFVDQSFLTAPAAVNADYFPGAYASALSMTAYNDDNGDLNGRVSIAYDNYVRIAPLPSRAPDRSYVAPSPYLSYPADPHKFINFADV